MSVNNLPDHDVLWRPSNRTLGSQINVQVGLGLFDRVTIGVRAVEGRPAEGGSHFFLSSGGTIRSFNSPHRWRDLSPFVHMVLLREDDVGLAVAVGANDFVGTKLLESRFVTIGRSVGRFLRVSGGFGFGPVRLDGLFGGAELAPTASSPGPGTPTKFQRGSPRDHTWPCPDMLFRNCRTRSAILKKRCDFPWYLLTSPVGDPSPVAHGGRCQAAVADIEELGWLNRVMSWPQRIVSLDAPGFTPNNQQPPVASRYWARPPLSASAERAMRRSVFRRFGYATLLAGLPLAFLGACDDGTLEPDPDPDPVVDSVAGVVEVPELPAVTIRGLVIDEADAPVAGATVIANTEEGDSIAAVATNAAGEYDFGNALTTLPVVLSATAEGFSTSVGVADVDSAGSAEIPELRVRRQEAEPVTVTPESGGTVATTAKGQEAVTVTLSVPAGAVTGTTTLSVTPVNPDGTPPAIATDGFALPLAAGVFGPSGTQFETPISVTLETADVLTTNGFAVRAREYDESTRRWKPALLRDGSPVPLTLNGDGTLTIQVDHFSIYKAELYSTGDATLEVSRTPSRSVTLPDLRTPAQFIRTRLASVTGVINREGNSQSLENNLVETALGDARSEFPNQTRRSSAVPVPQGVFGPVDNGGITFTRILQPGPVPNVDTLRPTPEACGRVVFAGAQIQLFDYRFVLRPAGNSGAAGQPGDIVIDLGDVPGLGFTGGAWAFRQVPCVTGTTGT